jgi:hypothetical protein
LNTAHEIILNKILNILYKGAVPIDRLEEAQALKAELLPIVQRTVRKPTGARKVGPVSEESARITERIVQLYGKGPRAGGLTWSEIAPVMAREGFTGKNGPLTKDACQHRYESWAKLQDFDRAIGQNAQLVGAAPPVEAVHVLEVDERDVRIKLCDSAKEAAQDLAVALGGSPLPEKTHVAVESPSPSNGTLKDMRCQQCKGLIGDKPTGRNGKIFCSKECADKTNSVSKKVESDTKTDSTIISMKKRGMNFKEIADHVNKKREKDNPQQKKVKWTAEQVKARYYELMAE